MATWKLPVNNIDSLNLNMRAIRLLVVRGEILYDKNSSHHDGSNRQLRLVLIENKRMNTIIDQVTITCLSKTYSCPFEYWIDSIHAQPYVIYRLEAMSVDRELAGKTLSQFKSKTNNPINFKAILTFATIIRDYRVS
ncbi:unnamed protein product [Adineta ricciae]|uniref:Uncharacterized protein n=1 Tax=Adineta ricciae TaxID=249248 RepID=A0A814D4R9_ADIRI|nr:unnamed protein product [Adineta ricciae]CAF1071354.1 unnamed protein product [Adineta ricciae]